MKINSINKFNPNPSGKQIFIVIGVIGLVLVLSGFVTNRKPRDQSENLTSAQLEQKKKGDISRLQNADNHLQRISLPVSVLKKQALERNE